MSCTAHVKSTPHAKSADSPFINAVRRQRSNIIWRRLLIAKVFVIKLSGPTIKGCWFTLVKARLPVEAVEAVCVAWLVSIAYSGCGGCKGKKLTRLIYNKILNGGNEECISSLHWLILGIYYGLVIQWSVLAIESFKECKKVKTGGRKNTVPPKEILLSISIGTFLTN